jgi:TonB family protein
MTEVWKKWETHVVNGAFPLHRYLGGSDHSGVFLTEYAAPEPVNAAIKLVPADPTLTEATLWRWRMAATLSHPYLVRVLDSGRCRLGGEDFLFVVMEYADQNLSEILPRRPLTEDEVGELLAPTLKALSFLHRENLVQGQLRPSNILVVNDRLKLASDTVHPAGEFAQRIARTSVYDPPEARSGRISTAADIWALGVTMVEALTQQAPAGPAEQCERVSLPAGLSQSLADTIRRCLSVDPDKRPAVAELQGPTKQESPGQAPLEHAPASQAASARAAPVPAPDRAAAAPTTVAAPPPPRTPQTQVAAGQTPTSRSPESQAPSPQARSAGTPQARGTKAQTAQTPLFTAPPSATAEAWDILSQPPPSPKRSLLPTVAVLLVAIAAIWGGFRFFRTRPTAPQPATSSSQAPSQQPASTPDTSETAQPPRVLVPPKVTMAPAPAKSSGSMRPHSSNSSHPPGRSRQSPANGSSPVLHEEIPNVPRSARSTIHGHVKVAVRVTVDGAGNVISQRLENPGPSKYFARLASEAARKWKFAAADNQRSREWLLQFEFTRDGATGQATTPRS